MQTDRLPATRAAQLLAKGVPYVQATVVRAQCPTSTRPGDSAIILTDGSIEGFVGGQCAESSVKLGAAEVMASGEPLLLRILPSGDEDFPESEGAKTVVNPCLSGGAIEVFLEPKLPPARIALIGDTPIADALEVLGAHLGLTMQRTDSTPAELAGTTAVLISSHGRFEAETIRSALDNGVQFIGLVASATRGAAILDDLGLTRAERSFVRTPVGFRIGARTAEEIALSILAELVQAVRKEGLAPAKAAEPVA